MIKKLKLDAYEGAIRCGGFFAWFLTVMYLCESNILDSELYEQINLTFLLAAGITGVVLVLVMLFLDFEGVMADKWLRWIPGLLMAESGVALSLSGTRTITLYAAIAGVAMVVGALGMLTTLMRVKVSQRIFSIGMGLAFGGIVRLICSVGISKLDGSIGRIAAAALIGIIAIFTAHTSGYSKEAKPLLASAEAKPSDLLKKIPSVYIAILILGGAFAFGVGCIESDLKVMITPKINIAFEYFDIISYAVFALTAFIAVFIVKPHALASLFAFGATLSVAAVILMSLQSPTNFESIAMTALCYGAMACFKMCMYLIIVTFSLDRPHPLFYAVFGFTVLVLSRLGGDYVRYKVGSDNLKLVMLIMVLLVVLGAIVISRSMRYSGFSQEQLEKRHRIRKLISGLAEEKELTDRERAMLNLAVLDGYSVEMMPDKLGVSRNTVKVQMRALAAKFGVDSLDKITEEINRMVEEKEDERKAIEEQRAKERSVLAALAGETQAETSEPAEEAVTEEEVVEEAARPEEILPEEAQPEETEEPQRQEKIETAAEEKPEEEIEEVTEEIIEKAEQEPEKAAEEKPKKEPEKTAIRVIRRDKDKKPTVIKTSKITDDKKGE